MRNWRNWMPGRPTTLLLAPGDVISIRAGRGGLAVSCVTGRLWVTTDRSREDTLLAPGRSAGYGSREVVVIEALRTAAVGLRAAQGVRQADFSPWVRAASQPRMAFFRWGPSP